MNDKISIPSICCRCGQKEGTHPWEINIAKSRSYYVTKKTATYEFVVGVCEPCLQVLQETKEATQLATVIAFLGGIPLGIILNKILVPEWEILSLTQEDLMTWLGAFLLIIGIGVVLSLVMKRVMEELYHSRLVTISSKSLKIRFTNHEFNRQFIALNPTISD